VRPTSGGDSRPGETSSCCVRGSLTRDRYLRLVPIFLLVLLLRVDLVALILSLDSLVLDLRAPYLPPPDSLTRQ